MLTSDHWFDGTPLWRDLGLLPGPAFDGSFTAPGSGAAAGPPRRTVLGTLYSPVDQPAGGGR
ncbi:hypothetical protein Srubr_64410 [Streptomyces rubradiris]|uniref:Uncharacterized protein n=1 Tax=Streptomyces rubradiris TaxID=285531 RepID=A0ABQ3RLC2_STRRR|nr:hypothetical protein GCM10018792_34390 [Streptomyces rubradiris]GHI56595.1 hypothetical protein Srubr_64410 [Streptomyces rubradiris]